MSTTTTQTDSRPTITELIDLSGRTALVTGSAMGIGRAIALRLHEAGASVVIADLDGNQAALVATELDARRPSSALAIHTDVGHAEDATIAVNAAVQQFGGLDILVNNAGIYPFYTFAELTAEQLERVLRVNLLGPFMMMKAAAAQMIKQGRGGRIINVTSVDAIEPSMVGLAAYDASKHGLWGLTKNVALELAVHGIAVNALAPGAVATPGATGGGVPDPATSGATVDNALRRMADPDEIARAALFLACGLSSYVIGSQVVVDAGMLLS